jgi:hypothetical protein
MTKTTWDPRTIYLYLVCLITLVMLIFSTVNVVRSVVELAYPEPQMAVRPLSAPAPAGEAPEVDERELEEQREIQKRWAQRNAVLNLARNLAMLLLAGPLYLAHWRRVRQEHVQNVAAQGAEFDSPQGP